MKVHVQGQSLRLRIDEDGLARLLAGGELVNETRAGDAALRQRLRLSEDTSPRLEVEGDDWTFLLPAGAVGAYVGRLPCRDALEFVLSPGGAPLRLAFEVDVRDSVRHRGPPARRRPPDPTRGPAPL